MMSDPRGDAAFPTLLERWDSLGWEKDEGIGLLFKEGGYVEFLGELARRAPRTLTCVLDEMDARGTPHTLIREVSLALALPDLAQRRARLSTLEDLYEPRTDFETALRNLDPPMSRTFAARLVGWVDLAANIEMRASGLAVEQPATPLGKTVAHPKFGRGVIRKYEGPHEIATIEFEEHGEKRIALRFVEIL